MFVKICGVTTAEAVAAAVDAGADAIGFVFAESPRRVSPREAQALCRGLDARIKRVAVMRHPTPELAAAVLAAFEPDWLQTDAEDFRDLALPATCEPLPVYRGGTGALDAPAVPSRFLFEGPRSGTGERADWAQAGRLALEHCLVLAGGLDPDNVADAIERIRPWGVDVSSGVEREPGLKDPDKIRQFVRRARAAAREDVHADR